MKSANIIWMYKALLFSYTTSLSLFAFLYLLESLLIIDFLPQKKKIYDRKSYANVF